MTDKYIAILQTGQPIQPARDKYGDFDELFINSMNISQAKTRTFRIYDSPELPNPEKLMGILITGSPAMVTEGKKWCIKTQQWLKQFINTHIPILGVCYGHQLLALMLGGKVSWNPKGREMGQIRMKLTTEAYKDKLFGKVIGASISNLKLQATHQQAVMELPKDTTLLGYTNLDNNHCFCAHKHIWGFQFHPEFTPEIIANYINIRKADIKKEGLDPNEMLENIKDINNGTMLLQQFKNLCLDYASR